MSNFLFQVTACLLALFIFEAIKPFRKSSEKSSEESKDTEPLDEITKHDIRVALDNYTKGVEKMHDLYKGAKDLLSNVDVDNYENLSKSLDNRYDLFQDAYDAVILNMNKLESMKTFDVEGETTKRIKEDLSVLYDKMERVVKEFYNLVKETKESEAMVKPDIMKVSESILDMQRVVKDYEQWSEAFEYTSKRFKDLVREPVDSSDLTQARIEAEYKDVVEAFNNMNSAGECLIALQHNFFTPDIWARACTGNNISMGKMTEYMRNYRDFKGNVKVK